MPKLIGSSLVIAAKALLLVMGSGCRSQPKPAPPPYGSDCRLNANLDTKADGGCHSSTCGGNSPVVNSFPFNGLHPDGCLNAEGAALALTPYSLDTRNSKCDIRGSDLYLDFEPMESSSTYAGYQLIVKSKTDPQKRCHGSAVVGTTFTIVHHYAHEPDSNMVLRVSQIGTTYVRTPDSQPADDPSHSTPCPPHAPVPALKKWLAYLITPANEPAHSLCMSPPLEELPLKSTHILHSPSDPLAALPLAFDTLDVSDPAKIEDEELPLYALIIPGAVYDYDARLIPKSASVLQSSSDTPKSSRWFNIACTGDALAQTELAGFAFEPITDKTADTRLPALHMLTAKYCNGNSATTRGNPIAWKVKGRSSNPKITGISPVEAHWDKDGATCVAHSRLWMVNKVVSLPSQLVPLFDRIPGVRYPMSEDDFLNKLCPDNHIVQKVCEDDSKQPLESFPVNHVDGNRLP